MDVALKSDWHGKYDVRVYCDKRWVGQHGIGRFAANVLSSNAIPIKLSGNPASPLDTCFLSFALLKVPKNGLFFSPGYNSPFFSRIPFVFTLHDLNHIDRPENSSILKRLYYAFVLKRACHRAARILTVSEFSKRRIVEWSGVSPQKVVSVGNGVDPSFRVDVPGYTPGFPYLLCISNRKGHKNEHRIVQAFAKATVPKEVQLIFTGYSTRGLRATISECAVAERVRFMGKVLETDLPSLYKGAVALLFPSLYEGFGLPVLEAMACGTPVITSDRTSLPEVAGDAAILVDPESVEAIRDAIVMLMNDRNLQRHLRQKGLERAAKFKWETAARRVSEVLDSVC